MVVQTEGLGTKSGQIEQRTHRLESCERSKYAEIIQNTSTNFFSAGKTVTISTTVRTLQATSYLYMGATILGINMPQRYKALYVVYAVTINLLVTLYLPIAFGISYFRMEDLHIGNMLTSLQVAINVFGCSLKLIIMAFLLPKLRSANAVMDLLDKRCQDERELAELPKIVRQGKRLFVLFAIAYWSYSTSTFIASVSNGRPPYAIYNPFVDWRRSKSEFFLAALIEFALMDVACFQQVLDDSYAVIYVSILRTHVKILKLRVLNLCSKTKRSSEDNFEELKMCIKDHKNLLHLFDIIAPVISIITFIQFLVTATVLGITLINILLFASDFSSRIASCFYVLAVVVEIFPLCYYVQCLMDESEHFANMIFHSNWVDQDMRYRKMLIFFMQRSQRTMELTAGKLVPITLNSFVTIAKFSFTVYTCIKEMGIKEKLGIN